MQTCWGVGNVPVNAEDRQDVHGRCRVSEDEGPESAMWEGSYPLCRPGLPGKHCWQWLLPERDWRWAGCLPSAWRTRRVRGNRRYEMGRDARTNTAQLYTLMELELPRLLRPNQVVEGRLWRWWNLAGLCARRQRNIYYYEEARGPLCGSPDGDRWQWFGCCSWAQTPEPIHIEAG